VIVIIHFIPEDGQTAEVKVVDTTKLPDWGRRAVENAVHLGAGLDSLGGAAWTLWDRCFGASVELPTTVEGTATLWGPT